MPATPVVVVEDARTGAQELPVDLIRWQRLAIKVLQAEHVGGELTLAFVDTDEIAELNAEHMGKQGPTDVLSFPLDDPDVADDDDDVPVLLGDVVVCPAVAAAQAPQHAGTYDDELALLVVHGILHVLGHDHAEPAETETMRRRELEHLCTLHWHGPAPDGFRQEHDDESGSSQESAPQSES